MLKSRDDAYRLLGSLGATPRLIRHLQLVGEAADTLIVAYLALGLSFDAQRIELGAAVHDAGKIAHPHELDGPGSQHEVAGQALLIEHGVQPDVARCCVTHRVWQPESVSFEERSVALADKLWKGKRDEALELAIIDAAALQLGVDRWDVFVSLDSVFEEIAAGGPLRLQRSKVQQSGT